jgi:hypothetical protein
LYSILTEFILKSNDILIEKLVHQVVKIRSKRRLMVSNNHFDLILVLLFSHYRNSKQNSLQFHIVQVSVVKLNFSILNVFLFVLNQLQSTMKNHRLLLNL